MRTVIIDDDPDIVSIFEELLVEEGHQVWTARTQAEGWRLVMREQPHAVLLDLILPDGNGMDLLLRLVQESPHTQVVMITGTHDIKTAVAAIKAGAVDFLCKPIDLDEFNAAMAKLARRVELEGEVQALRAKQVALVTQGYYFMQSSSMQRVYRQIERVAGQHKVTVLISGPTGTGKEHAAKLVHAYSSRAAGPFVEVHCAALPETLLEAELFGHEAGAFTDARKQQKGLFESAQGGTLFLDEIGEVPLSLQVKLLKVLEERKLRRLGSVKEIPLDLRIVAATNRDLEAECAAGRFRTDLFYRLNEVPISLPGLKECRDDIAGLAGFIYAQSCREFSKQLGPLPGPVLAAFQNYSWPGNIREMKHLIHRLVVLAEGALDVSDLPEPLRTAPAAPAPDRPSLSHDEAERDNIAKALETHAYNHTRAAKALGISRQTLINKIKKYGLEDPGDA